MNTLASRLTEVMAELGLEKPKDLADFCRVSEGLVSQWFSGRTKLGPKPLRALARTQFNLDWVTEGKLPKYRAEHGESTRRVRVLHPDDPLPDDVVLVPESRIEFAAGNGRTALYELVEDEEPATYRRSWFQKHGINPERVRRFRVAGDSMEPMLYARDTILVNLDERNVIDGKMYAIRYGDELRVKYLSRRVDGTLLLRSVNPAYPVEEVSPELVEQHISIIGRVRDTSGTGGL
ncbi:LexA family transcriptional regulator [Massilia phyllosphaerae]|uniref:LexA family transcriptional regulator n=1 Tax=Massilia phyllosphaerae TaxID=3106034 RepID=UPI002B1CD5B9|nr:S24 family peptidase [Massilia sp. SGZ-792]